jgi:purine-nucleoside/S-methyl-5'-thioadenosine phosphorylase / adenosine deaminase
MREQALTRELSAGTLSASLIQCSDLARFEPEIAHGFFTREGGRSTGIYRGLNVGLGSRDDAQTVRANRDLALARLGAENAFLATVHQTHSSNVVTVETPWHDDARPAADGSVANRPGIVLGVLTADCGPVLFADGSAGVIGVAHAGWKGAIGGILENTVAAMEAIGARRDRIEATLGPTISQENYEVGMEFVERFLAESSANESFFARSPKPGHSMFDLPAYILARLRTAGLDPSWTGECTYGDATRFFSFRRATHRGEPDYGRQLSAIMIRG